MHLLDEWKAGRPSWKNGPKFVPVGEAGDVVPPDVTPPELLVLLQVEGKLVIPQEIRQKFLGDPIRSVEWKAILKKFDKIHGPNGSTPAAVAPVTPSGGSAVNPAGTPGGAAGDEDVWKNIFPDEPKTLEELISKYEPSSTFSAPGGSLVVKVVEGPKFFLAAPVAGALDDQTPVITHGAGTWLLDSKAEKMLKDCLLLADASLDVVYFLKTYKPYIYTSYILFVIQHHVMPPHVPSATVLYSSIRPTPCDFLPTCPPKNQSV